MDAYVWIDSKTGDAMVTERDGSVRKIDLPDEMYEDLLYSKMRRLHDLSLQRVGWILPPASATPLDPVDPDDELDELDMEWDDDEVTQPMAPSFDQMQHWKDQGLCPRCGDKKRERAVGICSDHGKFMG